MPNRVMWVYCISWMHRVSHETCRLYMIDWLVHSMQGPTNVSHFRYHLLREHLLGRCTSTKNETMMRVWRKLAWHLNDHYKNSHYPRSYDTFSSSTKTCLPLKLYPQTKNASLIPLHPCTCTCRPWYCRQWPHYEIETNLAAVMEHWHPENRIFPYSGLEGNGIYWRCGDCERNSYFQTIKGASSSRVRIGIWFCLDENLMKIWC